MLGTPPCCRKSPTDLGRFSWLLASPTTSGRGKRRTRFAGLPGARSARRTDWTNLAQIGNTRSPSSVVTRPSGRTFGPPKDKRVRATSTTLECRLVPRIRQAMTVAPPECDSVALQILWPGNALAGRDNWVPAIFGTRRIAPHAESSNHSWTPQPYGGQYNSD